MSPSTKTPVLPAEDADAAQSSDSYELPVLHTRVPTRIVNAGFWGGLTGAVLLGAIDPPLGILLGVGVVVARHRTQPADATA